MTSSDRPQHRSVLETAEDAVYARWKRYGAHFAEYAGEFAGTAFHVFVVVAVVAVMFASGSSIPHWIPSRALRLFIAGFLIGGSASLVALSPPGRLSGAHVNPAITFGFWTLGRIHNRDLAGYIVAQMLGGICGVLAGAALIPNLARQTRDAALPPGPGLNGWAVFGLEALATFVLATVVFGFVASKRLMRYTPAVLPLAAGILVMLFGTVSGAGLNPARWLGPAVAVGQWQFGWAYVLGPIAGAMLAAVIRLHPKLPQRHPHTCKIFHDSGYRSIFKHETVLSTPPKHLQLSSKT